MQLPLPQFGRLEISGDSGRRLQAVADSIRRACGQSDFIPFDPFLCAESFGISVQYVSFLGAGISGNVLRYPMKTVITIASSDNRRRQRFTVAHELAHLCFVADGVALPSERFDGSVVPRLERREEKLCNRLAAELLMPQKVFSRVVEHSNASFELLQSLGRQFDVSLEAALNRVRELRLWSIAQEQWRYEGGAKRQVRRLPRSTRCVVRRGVREKGKRQRITSQLSSYLRSARDRLVSDMQDDGGLAARIANGRYVVLGIAMSSGPSPIDSPEVFVRSKKGGTLAAFAVQ